MDGRVKTRVLRFLARGPATLETAADSDRVLLSGGDRGVVSLRQWELVQMVRDELIVVDRETVCISLAGRARMRRDASPDNAFQMQHRDVEPARIRKGDQWETVEINLAESPLAQLARRRGKSGKSFLTRRETVAGERLRSDYTRGQLVPRLGANWQAAVSSGRRGSDNGIADLTDSALAARQRVENALAAVGPELSGLLVDVCCFLKGMETVETERGWPVRSAKIVLKTALAALARHYWPDSPNRDQRATILHWGNAGFRPTTIGGT